MFYKIAIPKLYGGRIGPAPRKANESCFQSLRGSKHGALDAGEPQIETLPDKADVIQRLATQPGQSDEQAEIEWWLYLDPLLF